MSSVKDLLRGDVVDGSGTANNVAKWSDADTITDSGITDDGSTVTITGDVSIADKIIHTGDTNTAIRFPAADTVTIETGGSERVRVNPSGNVGIGTSAPQAKFHIEGIKRNGRVWEYSQDVATISNGTTLNIDIATTDITNYFVELDFSGTNTGNGNTSVCKTFHTGFLFGTQRFGVGNNNFWVSGVSNPVLSTPSFNVLRLAIANSSGEGYNASAFNVKVMLGTSPTAVVASISHSIT